MSTFTHNTPPEHERTAHNEDMMPVEQPSTQHKENNQEHQNFFVELVKFALLALVIVLPFRFFIAQPFIVSGASMSPTFETGQYLVIDRLSYRFGEPERGDVVIFRFPNNPSKFFIKRVIGLPGEIVRIQNGSVSIVNPTTGDSRLLDEAYLGEDIATRSGTATVLLGGNEYFVMGDNRGASSDSRDWGPVPQENIVGRAYLRLLPPTLLDILPGTHDTMFVDETITNNT
jgi:signal peptidase I